MRVEAPVIAPSAYKHGVDEQTILHAFNNPIRSEDLEEGLVMLIGPATSMSSGSLAQIAAR